MAYYLSADIGGTKTEFCLYDSCEDKKIYEKAENGNFKTTSIDNLRSLLNNMVDWIWQQKVDPGKLTYSVFGVAGCDAPSDYKMVEEEIMSVGFPYGRFEVRNDGILAFLAQMNPPGIMISVGTGSIVWGINKDNQAYRSGGWGQGFSDFGSGYWIGQQALQKTLLYCDGCVEGSPLFDRIVQFYQARDFKNFITFPYELSKITTVKEIAAVAPVVIEAAEEGIDLAEQIIMDGFRILAKQSGQIAKRMGIHEGEPIKICYSGGILKHNYCRFVMTDLIKQEFSEHEVNICIAEHEPVEGGILIATYRTENDKDKKTVY